MKCCTAIPGNRSQGSWSGNQGCLHCPAPPSSGGLVQGSAVLEAAACLPAGCKCGGCWWHFHSAEECDWANSIVMAVRERISQWGMKPSKIAWAGVCPVPSWSHPCFSDISNSLTSWTLLWNCITSTLVLPACVSVMSQCIPTVVTENAETGYSWWFFSVIFHFQLSWSSFLETCILLKQFSVCHC